MGRDNILRLQSKETLCRQLKTGYIGCKTLHSPIIVGVGLTANNISNTMASPRDEHIISTAKKKKLKVVLNAAALGSQY